MNTKQAIAHVHGWPPSQSRALTAVRVARAILRDFDRLRGSRRASPGRAVRQDRAEAFERGQRQVGLYLTRISSFRSCS